MNYLQKNLVFLRKTFSVTQSELASWMKKGQTTIAGWENGASEPGVESLLKISGIFGIYIDDFIKVDMEKGKLITDEHLSEFHKNGKVIGKPIGKVMAKNPLYSPGVEGPDSTISEHDSTREWVFMKILKEMDGKLDQVLISVNKDKKSKS